MGTARMGLVLAVVSLLCIGAGVRGEEASEIAQRVLPSVALLVMEDAEGKPISMGSGFVVREGVVATNLHVVTGAARGYAKLVGQDTRHDVRGIVASDPTRDLVLLAVDGAKAKPLPVGDSNAVMVGDTVYVVGNPQGLEGTFSAGIVSSVRKVGDELLLQITAPISSGSSGGPVVNREGKVIGVAFGTIEGGQNLNFVIPSAFLSVLIAQRGEVRGLGVGRKDELQAVASQQLVSVAVPLLTHRKDELPAEASQHVKTIRDAAESGDVFAMAILGTLYLKGRGVPQDDREAMTWYRRAADSGNTIAMFGVGDMYLEGRGVAQDDREAVNWYRKAAEHGEAAAMVQLGRMYARGAGVPQDDREAVKWYQMAANAGHTSAMSNLGWAYQWGRGVPQDSREAVRWYEKAAVR